MKKIGLIINTKNDIDFHITSIVAKWCEENSVAVLTMEDNDLKLNNLKLVDELDFYINSDIVIVIGGDGTVLHHAGKISHHNIPMLGINCGTVGYLTVVDKEEIIDTLNNVLNLKYKIDKHSLITSCIGNEWFNSLNEISIKSSENTIINLSVYIDGVYTHTFRGDGILICTPSGSTAYNLSSGGPLIMSNANVICLTPICSHELFAKPIIINDSSEVKIVMDKFVDTDVKVISDGQYIKNLDYKSELKIKKAETILKIINPFEKSFYKILLKKLTGVSEKI